MNLSIVIVNWNTREMLRDCLASVLAGGKPDDTEIIVVDNASADGSPEMVEADFPSVILIRNTENRGFAAANNQGFDVAKGRYVLLLNSDTLVHGCVLEDSVTYMESHPDVGAMGCRVLNTDGTVQLTCSQFPTLFNLLLLTSGLWKLPWPRFLGKYQMTHWRRDDERDVDVISGCYLMVRDSALAGTGGLDEDFFFFGEETDWCRRLADDGWKLRFAPVGEITHFGGGSVRRLNHVRDLMLSNATVRLHRKHGGVMAAGLAWLILFGFNLSRAVFWSFRSALSRARPTRERRDHFLGVTGRFGEAWTEVKRDMA